MGSFFKLKRSTTPALLSSVVYKFTCSRELRVACIGMSARHLLIRANEQLHTAMSAKTAISQHICQCSTCRNASLSVNNFNVIQKCNSEYDTKVHEGSFSYKKAKSS